MTWRELVLLSSALVAGAAVAASRTSLGAGADYSFKAAIQIQQGAEFKTLGVVDADVRLLDWLKHEQPPDEARARAVPSEQITLSWTVTRKARGCTIRVADETRFSGWYLSYDPHAPAQGVFLAQRPDAGSYWEIDRVFAATEKNSTPIRAQAIGHGWHLDFDKSHPTYMRTKPQGTPYRLFELKLTEGRGARFTIDDFGK